MGIDWDFFDQMRRDITPLIIPWWNKSVPRTGFPTIPEDWVPWPEVLREPEEGTRDQMCFHQAKLANREYDMPLVLGIHFGLDDVKALIGERDPPRMPYAHAVNLDKEGRVVDVTWGYMPQSIGMMVGRGFGIAPTSDLKTYCKNHGFVE